MTIRLCGITRVALFLVISIWAFADLRGAQAGTESYGVGLAFGEPGGLTGYYRIGDKSFAQAYLSHNLLAGADVAMTFPRAFPAAPAITPFIGGGAFVFSYYYWWHDTHSGSGIGIRMPIGIQLKIPDAPFHLHAEITPSATVIPAVYSFAQAMMGVRYLF